MLDETNLESEMAWFHEGQARITVQNLAKRNIEAQYVPDRRAALSILLAMIPPGATVGCADSVTLHQTGILSKLKERNMNELINPVERDAEGYAILDGMARRDAMRKALTADIFLTGTNSITIDGQLVNTDGLGNRVAAMAFGPEKVIVVAGINKIVKNVDDALERIRTIAAPINAKRHYAKHHRDRYSNLPCVRSGICADCKSPHRICAYTLVIDWVRVSERGRLNVVLVGEHLGI